MGTVNDYLDDAKTIKSGLKVVLTWAKAERRRRIFIYFMIALGVVSGYNYFTSSKLAEAYAQEELYGKQVSLTVDKNVLNSAINIVSNCIDARDKKLPLEKWYCDFATTKYNSFKDLSTLDEEAQKLIETSKAYELMLLDLKGQLQDVDYKYLIANKPDNPAMKTLKILVSDIFLVLLLISSIGVILFLYWYLNQPDEQS